MPSQIGHNNPPKDRKINYKSISLHKITVKDLTRCAEHITYVKNCFRLLNGKKPIKQVSIPYVIEVMLTQYILNELNPSYQDNGRSIYEQTFHSLLRTSKSKKGLKLKGEKTDEE
tara:strand:- start:301 stop:645 length:345 start_codon:yes stop_codon:yes gene_type:complete